LAHGLMDLTTLALFSRVHSSWRLLYYLLKKDLTLIKGTPNAWAIYCLVVGLQGHILQGLLLKLVIGLVKVVSIAHLSRMCNVPFQIGAPERRLNGLNRPVRL
jgi:hypothetical protein